MKYKIGANKRSALGVNKMPVKIGDVMKQEYIDQALAVVDSFYYLGFFQGLLFGLFGAFIVFIKYSD